MACLSCCRRTALLLVFVCFLVYPALSSKEKKEKENDGDNPAEKWKKKDVRDYSEADMERLFEQWEDADEEKLEEDELPEWKREPPKIDLSKIDTKNPEGLLKMSKKGRTLMMFASVSGNPTQEETERVTQLWQSSLFNANVETQRYVVSENRVIFMLKDGAHAWDVKDFLVKQERCLEVTIEGQNYPGLGAGPQAQAEGKKAEEKKQNKPKTKKDNEVKKDKKTNDNNKKDKKIEDNKTSAKNKEEL